MKPARTLRLPVDVYADLNVDTPAGRVAVTADGRTVNVSADRLEVLRRIGAPVLASDRPARRRNFARVRDILDASDTDLIFTVGSREIARTERAGNSGIVSRVLGLPGVRVRMIPLIRAMFGRA